MGIAHWVLGLRDKGKARSAQKIEEDRDDAFAERLFYAGNYYVAVFIENGERCYRYYLPRDTLYGEMTEYEFAEARADAKRAGAAYGFRIEKK